jgi:pimeloyl-ACP methyl ester carboxylesterase
MAEGPFPLIVFHHAAHSPSQIYDDYTELHGHWATHGYVVASVDGSALVSSSQSWDNLSDMSAVQLAGRELLLAESADETTAFAGRIDPDRVFVAGHSRGGGASLISLWREPALAGALCFAQVSPLQTPDPDWGDPEENGDRPFPERPLLFLAAGDDLDEPWPLPHSAYDQNSGPTVFVVEHGTNHEWAYDEGTPGWTTSDSDISWGERHALDQAWSTAFLERFARGDLDYEASLFGAPALSSTLSDRGVSTSGRRYLDSELLVDDFSGETGEDLLGGVVEGGGLDTNENAPPYTDGLVAAGRGSTQVERIADWTPARRLGWGEEEASLRFSLSPEGGGIDLREQRALHLRLSAPCAPPPGDCEEVEPSLSVTLIDADGAELSVEAEEGMGALGVVGRHWGQVVLPLDSFLPVDLSRVVAIELRFAAAAPPNDELWVDDPRLE